MRTVGMMLVDLATGPAGLPSRLGDELAGTPVLRRSVGRALSAERLARLALLAPPAQHERIRGLLGELATDPRLLLTPLADGPGAFGRVRPDRVRLARRWALSCWRGGIGGACWFDELIAPAAMVELAGRLEADAVAVLSADAALADAALIDAIVAQYEACRDRLRMAFSQAPPGLGTICASADLLGDLARTGQTFGRVLAYDPDDPRPDYVAGDATVKLPLEVMACPHRFCADTARGFHLLQSLLERLGEHPSAERSARAANALFADAPEHWPSEIDLELTTERPIGDVLRPGRPIVPARGPVDAGFVAKFCEWIADCPADDLLVTLGGHGDALSHPQWARIAAAVKQAGALGVALRTTGLGLDEPTIGRLLESAVDVLVVELDAATPAGYRALKGADRFEQVVGGMDSLLARRGGAAGPLLVAEMVKCPATLDEMEAFFDRWRFADEAHLTGLHDYAGQFAGPAGVGWSLAPPRRGPCRRIDRRLTVRADAAVVPCELALSDNFSLSRLADGPITQIWTAQPLARLRSAHRAQSLDEFPLCRACDQWHRP